MCIACGVAAYCRIFVVVAQKAAPAVEQEPCRTVLEALLVRNLNVGASWLRLCGEEKGFRPVTIQCIAALGLYLYLVPDVGFEISEAVGGIRIAEISRSPI